jgi:hypothetical protein
METWFREIVNMVYDTLCENVGMSEHHKRLEVADITSSSVAAESGKIRLTFRFGPTVYIQVSMDEEDMSPELEEELAAIAYDSMAHSGNPDSGHHNQEVLMRKLTEAQKQILHRYPSVTDVADLPVRVLDELEKLNDYETLRQDTNRYLWDQFCKGNPDAFHISPF